MNINDQSFLTHYELLLSSQYTNLNIKCIAPDIHHIQPKYVQSNNKIALVALTHGDEVIGLHIFIKLLEQLLQNNDTLHGELFLIIANRPAYIQHQRYIETDLNRAYGENDNTSLEEKRANIIKQVINQCDYIIDIHQCIEETLSPFIIAPFKTQTYSWINKSIPNIPIVARRNITSASTLSSYGFIHNKLAFTFEVGAYGFDNKQLNFGFESVISGLNTAWGKAAQPATATPHTNPIYEIVHFQSYSCGEVEFSKNFKNFEKVTSSQLIAQVGTKPIYATINGHLLLYPQKWFQPNSTIKADGLFLVLQPS